MDLGSCGRTAARLSASFSAGMTMLMRGFAVFGVDRRCRPPRDRCSCPVPLWLIRPPGRLLRHCNGREGNRIARATKSGTPGGDFVAFPQVRAVPTGLAEWPIADFVGRSWTTPRGCNSLLPGRGHVAWTGHLGGTPVWTRYPRALGPPGPLERPIGSAHERSGRLDQGRAHRERRSHPTYRKGAGPGVIVISEIPGITEDVIAFAEEVVDQGLTVVLPHLFGKVPSSDSPMAAVGSLRQAASTGSSTSCGCTRPRRSRTGCAASPATCTPSSADPVSARSACASPAASRSR